MKDLFRKRVRDWFVSYYGSPKWSLSDLKESLGYLWRQANEPVIYRCCKYLGVTDLVDISRVEIILGELAREKWYSVH